VGEGGVRSGLVRIEAFGRVQKGGEELYSRGGPEGAGGGGGRPLVLRVGRVEELNRKFVFVLGGWGSASEGGPQRQG